MSCPSLPLSTGPVQKHEHICCRIKSSTKKIPPWSSDKVSLLDSARPSALTLPARIVLDWFDFDVSRAVQNVFPPTRYLKVCWGCEKVCSIFRLCFTIWKGKGWFSKNLNLSREEEMTFYIFGFDFWSYTFTSLSSACSSRPRNSFLYFHQN